MFKTPPAKPLGLTPHGPRCCRVPGSPGPGDPAALRRGRGPAWCSVLPSPLWLDEAWGCGVGSRMWGAPDLRDAAEAGASPSGAGALKSSLRRLRSCGSNFIRNLPSCLVPGDTNETPVASSTLRSSKQGRGGARSVTVTTHACVHFTGAGVCACAWVPVCVYACAHVCACVSNYITDETPQTQPAPAPSQGAVTRALSSSPRGPLPEAADS